MNLPLPVNTPNTALSTLLNSLSEMIRQARQKALRVVDTLQVQTCWNMRGFYQAFPIWNAVRTELSWTHYRTLLRVESEHARQWYMNEAATLNWPTRTPMPTAVLPGFVAN